MQKDTSPMTRTTPLSIEEALSRLTFLPDRTPETTPEASADAFATIADYRDGAIFVAHYAGNSQWERHGQGDEIVMVIEGKTTLFLLEQGVETPHVLSDGQLIVVPQGLWHRFETPKGVKIMSVTPQPTDHQLEFPD